MSKAQNIALEASGVRLISHRVVLSEDETRLKNHLMKQAHDAAWQALTIDELMDKCELNQRDLAKKLCFALIKENKLVRAGDYILTKPRMEEGAQILKNHLQKKRHACHQRGARFIKFDTQMVGAAVGIL